MLIGAVPADSLRRTLHRVFAAPEFQWRETRHPLRVLWDGLKSAVDWLVALGDRHPMAFALVLAVMLVVLAFLLAHLGYVLWRVLRGGPVQPGAGRPALPVRHDAAWHAAEARRLVELGGYADAIGHRYVALLLALERRRTLVFHPSKTPAEYAAEARLDEAGRRGLAALTGDVYRYLFGGIACGATDWSQFDLGAARLEADVVAP
jgi:hypothetical protein